MDDGEKAFLKQMEHVSYYKEVIAQSIKLRNERAAAVKELWDTNRYRQPLPAMQFESLEDAIAFACRGSDTSLKLNAGIIRGLLVNASRSMLGMNARFEIEVSDTPEDPIRILPKNGAAERVLQRWENLYLRQELSKDD